MNSWCSGSDRNHCAAILSGVHADAVKTFQAFAIFSLGFLLRPLSGVVLGHLGDRIGRKKLFLFTVFAMAVPTMMIGLLPTYAQIGIAAPLIC